MTGTTDDHGAADAVRVAVAGGTGLVGALVVERLRAVGAEPVVLARSHGVDLTTGESLAGRLDGVRAVVDVTNVVTLRARPSVAFFDAVTRHLLAEGARAGVAHHVALSIVGCDRVDLPYYRGKRRQEELLAAGAVPWSVLRATQFHEFADQLAAQSPGPLAVVPAMRCRPVAAREVARRLVAVALAAPVGLLPDLAGPAEEVLPAMARRSLRHRGSRRPVAGLRLPGAAGRQVRAGGLLPGPDAVVVGPDHAAWLRVEHSEQGGHGG